MAPFGGDFVVSSFGDAISEHRQNSVAAFQAMADSGAKHIHCQLRATKDHVLVLSETDKACGYVVSEAYFDDLTCDVVERADELFNALPDDVVIHVELMQRGLAKDLLAIPKDQKIVITSFNPSCLMEAFHEDLFVDLGLMLDEDYNQDRLDALVEHVDLDFIMPHQTTAQTGEFWETVPDDTKIIPWDVGSPKEARELHQNDRVAGISTRDPDRFLSEVITE